MSRVLLQTRRALNELERQQRRGIATTRKLSMQLRRQVLTAYAGGQTVAIRDIVLRSMTTTLRDAMVTSHLMGLKTEREIAQQHVGTRLSVYDTVLRNLSRAINLDLRALQLQYQTQALRVLNDVSDNIEQALRKDVYELIGEGATVKEGIKTLNERFNTLGLTSKGAYQLETIYRTQTQLAYGAGRWNADQAPEIQEILWGYTYSAVGDDRTREEHLALDGTTLPKDDPFWERFTPPNGWNCRCQIIPVFETVEIVPPPAQTPDSEPVLPDNGFDFNPGRVFGVRAT